MLAVILVGHGSLHPGSGAAMIRLAARLRERGLAPLSGAGFLNYSRPAFASTIERAIRQGATEMVVVPYFLVPGKFVRVDLARLVASAQARHPSVTFQLAEPFGDHPALAQLILQRAAEADPAPAPGPRALLILVHGSPRPESNAPVYALAERIQGFAQVVVCFMDLNAPSIGAAIDQVVGAGIRRLVAVPYFLQLGGHVRDDLPAEIAAARARHPGAAIRLAEHLGYAPVLADVIVDRVAEALAVAGVE
jgi:sirohydrochlorin cobaltochelatase